MTILKLNLTRLTEKASRGSDSDLNSNYPRPDLFLSRNDPWWSLLWLWSCWQNTRPHKSDNYHDDESENSLIEGWWQLRGDLNLNWLLPACLPACPSTWQSSQPTQNPAQISPTAQSLKKKKLAGVVFVFIQFCFQSRVWRLEKQVCTV